jgi:hypothetical protein
MIRIFIREEYGYREWVADLTDDEYRDLLRRWETMRGLSCLVPVSLIISQAREVLEEEYTVEFIKPCLKCHIHESSDSCLEGSSYEIPDDEDFWMDGKKYERSEYWPNYEED